ncbi:hypothetical protein ZYGR_0S01910 [Zygosaccharomyces rouxii]|uniref:ZYRO0F06754p n=2 Tax=Zygosaccharomyces rouxii TaxID=4956 RepID=C5DXP7_ZYGRC|nr:uncharacterized protein ZYRO0F06754g [Zygosaccharomyces rouxii]KAH9199317.1 hypothetical protein LQ764DRAFT_128774 [Zygosaccharomyces rouxii]GAV50057.1 hypothetical protein ZYGR_0S01910 [Zygosaccharomyces rouxii]CAR28558.1 ZYRO0F06754p [Zygosaccharomyces rouxii]
MSLPSWCPPYSSRKTGVNGEDVYCICKNPDNGDLMVGCDGCDDWFHFKCLKIPETYRKLVYSFHCPYCEAGITGPASQGANDLPKTIWKRKCRLDYCYNPCQSNSKYCSGEHGEEYMRTMLAKVEIPGLQHDAQLQLFKDMANYHKNDSTAEQFQQIGNEEFIHDEPKDQDSLYAEIVRDDKRLMELQDNVKELGEKTIPATKAGLDTLSKYLKWLEEINVKLALRGDLNLGEDATNGTSTNARGKNKKKFNKAKAKQRNCICGYDPDFQIPCGVDEFVSEYSPDLPHVKGICVKVRCSKHSSWATMQLEEQEQQLSSLESYQTRLELLIRMRKEQLHIHYYEQLLRRKD